jgi:4-hydroxy-tetrahydrodipicolinate synthase
MRENGDIDYVCLRKLVDWHIAQRTDAIVVVGTTGEAATLDSEERNNIIKMVVEQTHRRIPVIASTGTNSTRRTIDQTRAAMEVGVDACLLITPYYNCPTQEGLYQHYRSIAAEVPIPQILYNVPKRTGCDVLPDTVAKLAGIANIVGIKESQPERAKKILELCGNNIDVYSGDDSTAVEIIRLGGKGVISVAANLLPQSTHNLYELTKKENWKAVEKIDQQLRPLYKGLFIETNPIPVKWLAAERGLISTPSVRLPLTELSLAHQADLRPILDLLEALS